MRQSGGKLLTRGGGGGHGWLMGSGGGSQLLSMVAARGRTKEVKGNVWVHWRRLGADGGGGVGQQIQGSGGGGDCNLFFLGCAMCLWATTPQFYGRRHLWYVCRMSLKIVFLHSTVELTWRNVSEGSPPGLMSLSVCQSVCPEYQNM